MIMDPHTPEGEGKAVDRVRRLLTRPEGSKILKEEDWGVRELSYRIGRVEKGRYWIIVHEAPPDVMAALRADLKLVEGVVRFLTLRLDEKAWARRQAAPASTGERPVEAPAAA